jgi:outer membrane protein assembly factor BamB
MPSRRHVLASLGTLSLGSAAGCLGERDAAGATADGDGTTDWPMAHFDSVGSSYNPKAVGPTEKPSERWSSKVGWRSGRPVVADRTVYASSQTQLRALDVESGEEQWSVGPTAESDAPAYTSPAVHDGTVYVGVGRGRTGLLALDAGDGSEQWRYDAGENRADINVPPVPDYIRAEEWESIVVATGDGVVHYLDIETQEPRWTFEVYGRISRLVTRGNVVYVGTDGGEVYALYDGEGLWRQKLPGKITALAVQHDGGDVFASTFGGGVFRLRSGAHAGRTAWHAEDGPVAHEAFVAADGRICGTDLADATVLDERSGDVQWEVDGDFGVPPAAAGDTLYLGGETGITAYELGGGFGLDGFRFGGKRWHYSFDGSVGSGVTVADGAVFAVDSGGEDSPSRLVALE